MFDFGVAVLKLMNLGWVDLDQWDEITSHPAEEQPTLLAPFVTAYQRFMGLDPDGVLGPRTARSLSEPRFCVLPDQFRGEECGWPEKQITWTIEGELPHATHDEWKACAERAWGLWADVCGIEPTWVDADAHISMRPHNFDGPGGVLADSMLPPCRLKRNADFAARQRYDRGETFWTGPTNRWPRNAIDLATVIAHELGHALGLGHLAAGNLMQPTLDRNITSPQADEIAIMQRLYGKARSETPREEGEERTYTIVIRGYQTLRGSLKPL